MTILGHDREVATFYSAMRGDRAPHAWLMAGPEGIGKASLAHLFARQLLSEAADPQLSGDAANDHPTIRLCDASSHPDLYVLERLPKDVKAVRDLDRRDWPEGLERVRNISVDQVRGLRAACALKPSLSPRRIIIVDSIDDLERGAANAMLKTLEEPPAGTIFLLVTHAPGRLLPTIRSRCRMVRFDPLKGDVMTAILSTKLPGSSPSEIAALVIQGGGSPGKALSLAGLGLDTLYDTLVQIASDGDPTNARRAALASSFTARTQARYEAFLAMVPSYLSHRARSATGAELARTISGWEDAQRLGASASGGSLDPASVALRLSAIVASLAPTGASA
jgi:DNA polymerase III subunit delta'